MYLLMDTCALPHVSSLIRRSAGQGICAPHRSLSQLVTSFIASESLGIPRTLLLDFLVSSYPRITRGNCSIVKDSYVLGLRRDVPWLGNAQASLALLSPSLRLILVCFLLYVLFLQYVKGL